MQPCCQGHNTCYKRILVHVCLLLAFCVFIALRGLTNGIQKSQSLPLRDDCGLLGWDRYCSTAAVGSCDAVVPDDGETELAGNFKEVPN